VLDEPRSRKVPARFLSQLRIPFHRYQHAARWKRSGQPDSRISDCRPDLEDSSRADGGRQQAQQRSDFGIDQRKIALRSFARDVLQHRVGLPIQSGKVSLDGVRNDLTHNDS
jgi:hypothetical protein